MPTLAEIAHALNLPTPPAAPGQPITGVAMLAEATPTDLSFLGSEKYLPQFNSTQAAAVLVSKKVKLPTGVVAPATTSPTVLQVDDADLALAKILPLFAPPIPRPPVGAHPTAVISPSAIFPADSTRIAPHVYIGDHAKLGRNCTLHPGVYLGDHVTLGDDCELFPNVVIRERCTLGHRVTIHANSTIGSDGFGYRWNGRFHEKIPQIGTVIIEDDVEIGSNACLDRAKFAATVVGRGTKIDNLVQIAHNCRVGPHCVIVGQAGLAGSVTLGAGVVLGGQCAVRDHATVGDAAMIAACSGVADDVDPKTVVSGIPALPHRQTLREQAALRRLPDLVVQVRKLQEELDALKKSR